MKNYLNKLFALLILLNIQYTIPAFGQGRIGSMVGDKIKQSADSGDLIFTAEPNAAAKKKDAKALTSVTGDDVVFMTIYLNKKFSEHYLFKDASIVTLVFQTTDGKSVSHEVRVKPEDKDKKMICVELFSKNLPTDDYYITRTCNFLHGLGSGKHKLAVLVDGRDVVSGSLEFNFTAGTGKYGALTNAIETKRQADIAEDKRKKEEKEKQKQQAIKDFQSAPDAVKIAFKNTCEHPGNISVSTGDDHTSYSRSVSKGTQSEFVICRPGNKIYLGNELIHTVSAKSNNQVINICPKKPETAPECMGSRRISILYLENKSGKSISYSVTGDGLHSPGSLLSSDRGHITCCPYNTYLQVDGVDYIYITQEHDGKTIVIK